MSLILLSLAACGRLGVVEIRIDGNPVAQSAPANTAVPGGYDALEMIVYYEQPAVGPFEYFIDEVAVGDQPIGCI